MKIDPPRIIVAVNPQGVIAVDGQMPWRKPEDLKRFKRVTIGSTLIMGRKTWDSIGRRFLPSRRTLVLSRTPQPDVVTAPSLEEGLKKAHELDWANGTWEKVEWSDTSVWIVGGAEVYEQAIPLADEIDLTLVMNSVVDLERPNVIRLLTFVCGMPGFKVVETSINPADSTLTHCKYRRI
jgi:dihydrofolate reductase